MLLLTPVIVHWCRDSKITIPLHRVAELGILFTVTIVVTEFLFGGWVTSEAINSLPYLVLPCLIWAAFRFGPRETSTATVLVSVIAIWHTWSIMQRVGEVGKAPVLSPFVGPSMTVNSSLLALQAFICAVTLTADALAAALSDQRRLERRFRAAIESAPTAIVMIDRQGQIVLVNAQAEALFGYRRDELLGEPIELLVPERFRGKHSQFRSGFFVSPAARRMGAGRDLSGRAVRAECGSGHHNPQTTREPT